MLLATAVLFFRIPTSKRGSNMQCFVHLDLQMCFSLQRRVIFPHPNFQKWSEPFSFLAFCLGNVLRATAACNFSTSQLPKVVRTSQFFSILTSKCASRYSGVQFFHIPTSKSGPNMQCFVHFDFQMCFAPRRRANFRVSSQQRPPRPPLYRGYFSTQPTHKSLKNTACRDLSTFSRLLIFSLFVPVHLLACSPAFSTVHLVGS